VLEALERAGVAAVGIDAFFIQPGKDAPEGDEIFGQVMARYGRVALAAPCTTDTGIDLEELTAQVEASSLPAGPSPRFSCGRIVVPVEPLRRSSIVTQVEISRSASGNVRGAYLLAEVAGRTLPSLSLATYLLGQGLTPETGLVQEEGGVRVGSMHIPLNKEGAVLTSFRMPDVDHFLSYGSLFAAIGDTEPPTLPPEVVEGLRGKYVLLGQTAESIRDLGPFANGMQLPLVLLHGALLGDLLEKHPVREVPRAVEFALLFFCGALLTAAALVLRPTLTFGAVLMVLLGILGGTLLLAKRGLVLAPLGPMAASVLAFALVLAGRLSAEERARSRVRGAFDGYMDEAALGRLLADAESSLLLKGSQRRISVLYTQVQEPFGDRELPPEERIQRLHQAFEAMTGEVVRRKGRIESLRGNGLLAVFGDPLSLPDHATRAVEAALALPSRVQELSGAKEGSRPLVVRVGVATGEAVIGNVGLQDGRVEYVVMGAPLERALVLTSQAAEGGVLVSSATREACSGRFGFAPIQESELEEPAYAVRTA
jgi:class 3 adenylate cyclase